MNKGYNKRKFFLAFTLTVAVLALISHLFVPDALLKNQKAEIKVQDADSVAVIQDTITNPSQEGSELAYDMEDTLTDTIATDTAEGLQDIPVFTSSKVWSYPECFPDSNKVHITVAEEIGVAPMKTRQELEHNIRNHRLVSIASSPYYMVDELTHSVPYLIPQAQQLINTISINFMDSLISKGLPLHLPIVTSVLRTGSDIENLQKGNRNSVTNSAHQYGTTVDITYNRFQPLNGTEPTRYNDNLKKTMAEVLYDLREQGLCYVKYERRQACFHLTVR